MKLEPVESQEGFASQELGALRPNEKPVFEDVKGDLVGWVVA